MCLHLEALGYYANRKQNKRRLPVTVIIMTLDQILTGQSITETVGCLVEQDKTRL